MVGPERLQQLATTASLSFWLLGCLSRLSHNQSKKFGCSVLAEAVHKADSPLYNSDIYLSFIGTIAGDANGQE